MSNANWQRVWMHLSLSLGLGAALFGSAVTAQTFPDEDRWVALRCKGGVVTDLHRDQAGASDERDIVGDDTAPAGYRAADGTHLFLRMRLDTDPAPGGSLRPFAWHVALDTDAELTTFEVLLSASGTGNKRGVALYKNTVTDVPDDVTETPDLPEVATYEFATHGRSVTAPGSNFGDNSDFFIEFAIPWRDLEPLGVTPSTQVAAWLATSSNANNMTGDFACHDGSTGTPTLSGIAPDRIILDPEQDTDGDGFTDQSEVDSGTDPFNPEQIPTPGTADAPLLRGGGGCAAVPAPFAAGILLVAGAIFRARARHPRSEGAASARMRL